MVLPPVTFFQHYGCRPGQYFQISAGTRAVRVVSETRCLYFVAQPVCHNISQQNPMGRRLWLTTVLLSQA